MSLNLPKITNVSAPGRQATPDVAQAGRDFNNRLANMTKVSQARMSEIINSGRALRQATVAKSNLQNAEAATDIQIQTSKSKEATGAVGLVEASLGAMERYDIRQSKSEVNKYLLGEKEVSVQFDREHGGKTEYESKEVPESIKAQLGIPDTMKIIPAYMVQAEWKREVLQASLQNNSQSISNQSLRENAIAMAQGYEITEYGQQVKSAITAQPIYETTKTIEKATTYLNNNEFGLAIETIELSDIEKELKTKWINKVTNEKQDFDLTSIETLDPANPETLVKQERALELMRDRDVGTTGALTPAQYRGHVDRLEGNVKAYKDAGKKADKVDLALVKDRGRKANSLAYEGVVINDQEFINITDKLRKDGSPESKVLLQNMVVARQYAKVAQDVNRAPLVNQLEIKKRMKDNIVGADTLTAFTYQKQIEAIDKGIAERQKDALFWGQNNGVIAMEPIDYKNIGASLFQREGVAGVMQDNYQAFTGYLTDTEAGEFATFLDDQPTDGKLDIFAQVFQGFNGDLIKSASFYEQLKAKGVAGTTPVAGQIMSRGDRDSALKVIEGSLIRKESEDYFSRELKADVKDYLIGKLGTIYRYNNVERGLIEEAVYDTIAYENQKMRDTSGYPETNRMWNALQSVTGGVTEYEGAFFQTPANLSPRQTNDWIDDLSPIAFKATGHGSKVKEMISDGDLNIVGVGQNLYRLTDDQGNEVKTSEGTSFEFSYNPNYPSITAAKPALELDVSGGIDPKTGKVKKLTDMIPVHQIGGILGVKYAE